MEYHVVIRGVSLVGMHHWGITDLPVGSAYMLRPEPDNVADSNAVAVVELKSPHQKRGYLSRTWAKKLQKIILNQPCLVSLALLLVRRTRRVVHYWTGPEHRCTVGFSCQEDQKEDLEAMLRHQNVCFTIKERK
jgi:hypothetical protein